MKENMTLEQAHARLKEIQDGVETIYRSHGPLDWDEYDRLTAEAKEIHEHIRNLGSVPVHHIDAMYAYDRTQTDPTISHGDVLVVDNKLVAWMDQAWPVSLTLASQHEELFTTIQFHRPDDQGMYKVPRVTYSVAAEVASRLGTTLASNFQVV